MEEIKKIKTPLDDEVVKSLKSGDRVLLNGAVYTARDAAHKRLIALIDEGKQLPVDFKGQIIYYVGPTPPRPGKVIGSAGPTTSLRMDTYTPKMLEQGLKGIIGKGFRSKQVIESLIKFKAVYFAAIGGAGALLSKCIKSSEVVAYEDLGTEAIRKIIVENLPLYVVNDINGNDLYNMGIEKYKI